MEQRDEIVVYQPNETLRLDVRLEDGTVWLSQAQISELFNRSVSVISRHIKNVFDEGEVESKSNLHFLQIANSDKPLAIYSLNVIISVGYRVKSLAGTQFRIWATRIIRQQILGETAFEPRMTKLENRMDVLELELKRAQPLPERIFCAGQEFDAYTFFCGLVRKARNRIRLVDNYIDDTVLTLLDKRGKNVTAQIYTGKCTKQLQLDLSRHNAQYSKIEIVPASRIHDRFLIIDEVVYLVGASIKDAGHKKFAVIRMAIPPEMVLPIQKRCGIKQWSQSQQKG